MEVLKHECGVALIRLLKPLDHYRRKYGSRAYGLERLYLMMEKQHNRGQEGAGIACVDTSAPVGTEYMFRERAEGKDAISQVFAQTAQWPAAALYMGHLRYSTTGRSGLTFVHPFLRRNNWRARNLCLCGNFNMTNIDAILAEMTRQGQSPRTTADTLVTLERMGHRLDREVERLYTEARQQGLGGLDVTRHIEGHIDMARVLRTTMEAYDGGYVMCGMTGSGEMFAMRDPWNIRPAFYLRTDELVAVASERPALQAAFGAECDDIRELAAGEAIIVTAGGDIRLQRILPQQADAACSFERIYFSRSSDRDIYCERKQLGQQLATPILQTIGGTTADTVFSFIPNTAEVAFYGMVEGLRQMGHDVHTEKVAWKDIKLRTFIADAGKRNDLASHVYDVTYGSVRPGRDQLVVIDDSIVRGTTLHESILKMLARLQPRKIVMVSSAPQIRYPDFYGIDMARLEELCAFRAAIRLIEERGMQQLIDQTYTACKTHPTAENHVRHIYEPFSADDISRKIAQMLRPADLQTPVELVFQSIDGLHAAIPRHHGDWYFTGHYPTPGGTRMANQAFVQYYEESYQRSKSANHK